MNRLEQLEALRAKAERQTGLQRGQLLMALGEEILVSLPALIAVVRAADRLVADSYQQTKLRTDLVLALAPLLTEIP